MGSLGNTAACARKDTMSKTIKYKRKGECLQLEQNDLQGICQFAIESLQRHGGRNAKYANTEEERQRFVNDCIGYFRCLYDANQEKEQDQMLIPSVEGLCLYLGISRVTLFNYCKRSDEWSETVNMARNAIATARTELATHFKIPPLLHLFDMVNNHPRYYNTSQFVISTEQPEDTQTPQIAESQLARIAVGAEAEPQLPDESFSQ